MSVLRQAPDTGRPPATPPPPPGGVSRSRLTRLAPLAALVCVMGVVYALGWHKLLSFEAVGQNYDWLKSFIATHRLQAIALYAGLYLLVVALSLPGGLVMTLVGGLLFGWQIAAPVTVVAATLGATVVFMIARSSIGTGLAQMAGPRLAKLQDGFRDNALSYLLFLRLVPVFPFVVVNVAPAFLGVPLSTYVIGTVIGIIPGSTAFSIAGAGLGSVVEAQNAIYAACTAAAASDPSRMCTYAIDTSALVTRELLLAFAALGVTALIPIAIKTWSRRHAAA